MLLLCRFLVWLVLDRLLVLLVACIGTRADGLLAGVRVRGRDDELVDFERVGILGGRRADTEVVVLGELDLLRLVSVKVM